MLTSVLFNLNMSSLDTELKFVITEWLFGGNPSYALRLMLMKNNTLTFTNFMAYTSDIVLKWRRKVNKAPIASISQRLTSN